MIGRMNPIVRPGSIRSFRDLLVWQKARRLAADAYQVCQRLPHGRHQALIQQMLRAAISVPSNIAEGDERGTNKDSLRFLQVARGSLAELETQMGIAHDVGLLSVADAARLESQIAEVSRLLGGSIRMRMEREKKAAQP